MSLCVCFLFSFVTVRQIPPYTVMTHRGHSDSKRRLCSMDYLNHSAPMCDIPLLRAEEEVVTARRETERENCGCAQSCHMAGNCLRGWGLADHPLAMVYAPCQGFEGLYDPDTALLRGTLFPELDLPLEAVGRGCRKNTQPSSSGCARPCHM